MFPLSNYVINSNKSVQEKMLGFCPIIWFPLTKVKAVKHDYCCRRIRLSGSDWFSTPSSGMRPEQRTGPRLAAPPRGVLGTGHSQTFVLTGNLLDNEIRLPRLLNESAQPPNHSPFAKACGASAVLLATTFVILNGDSPHTYRQPKPPRFVTNQVQILPNAWEQTVFLFFFLNTK